MPIISRLDGCQFEVGRVSDQQLSTKIDFAAGRDNLVVITVTAVDGRVIEPTQLVIGDTHSIWATHQAVRIAQRGSKRAVQTGLSAVEAEKAAALFRTLVENHTSTLPARSDVPSSVATGPATKDRVEGILTSIRNHRVIAWFIVLGIIVTALGAFAESILKLIGIFHPK